MCNVYDLTSIPKEVLIDLTANLASPLRTHGPGEVFHDMFAVAPALAAADTTIVRSFNNDVAPTVDQFLNASRRSDKIKVRSAFAKTLFVCAASKFSPDKYRKVLASPMRHELARFCGTAAGLECSTINAAYEIGLSAYYEAIIPVSFTTNFADSKIFLGIMVPETQRLHGEIAKFELVPVLW